MIHSIEESGVIPVNRSDFFPAISDIAAQIDGSIEDRAIVAWYHIFKVRKKFGFRKSIRFSTPETHYAIEHMGAEKFLHDTEQKHRRQET